MLLTCCSSHRSPSYSSYISGGAVAPLTVGGQVERERKQRKQRRRRESERRRGSTFGSISAACGWGTSEWIVPFFLLLPACGGGSHSRLRLGFPAPHAKSHLGCELLTVSDSRLLT